MEDYGVLEDVVPVDAVMGTAKYWFPTPFKYEGEPYHPDPLHPLNASEKQHGKSASSMQIGGNHYKDMPIQPSEYITKNGLGWYEGNAIKYISRHAAKGGKQDIEKAIHYLELLLESLE